MAIARKTDRTYQTRLNDGSVETRFYHEIEHNGVVTETHGPGAAQFAADCYNGQWSRANPYTSLTAS